jgi:imidazolonepropionase-like amidohydrolase
MKVELPIVRVLLAPALLAAALVGQVAAEPAKPFDRSAYYDRDTHTSDDPRRVPVPAKTDAPVGVIVLENARLFDGTGAPARSATIVIESNKIASILPVGSRDWPKDAQVIDVANRTLMPGLIDLHTHLTYVQQFGLPPETGEESQADAAMRGVERLRYFVESGVTSVRDVASHGMAPFILKRWVAEGRVPGPRIFAAGQLIVGEGGHGTEGFAMRTAPGYPDAAIVEANGPEAWRAAVRRQFKRGADLIKLASHFSQAEVEAAVDEAHKLGIRVTVDAETIFIKMAADAGVDCVEHPLPRSNETVQLMATRGVYSVPTIVPYQYINDRGGYFGSTSRRFTISDTTMFEMVSKMKRAGVKLGVGTDLVVDWYQFMPEPYIQELKNFGRLGFSHAEALVAATRTNAEILGMSDRLGTIEPGKLADLVLIDGAPDRNIDELRNVTLVMVNGRIVVRDGRLFVPRHPVLKAQDAVPLH